MKTIQLTQGYEALVDDEDYEELSKYNWFFSNGYALRAISHARGEKQKRIPMHRQIMNAAEHLDIDHKNLNKLDNQKHNLRPATSLQNKRNTGITTSNASGFKGVFWNQRSRCFMATIKTKEKRVWLGSYETALDAAKAYDAAAKKFYGEFAWLNGVDLSIPPKKWVRRQHSGMPSTWAMNRKRNWAINGSSKRVLKIIEVLGIISTGPPYASCSYLGNTKSPETATKRWWDLVKSHCNQSGLTLQY